MRRSLALLAALAVAISAAVLPASASSAAGQAGQITLQLVSPAGRALTVPDLSVMVTGAGVTGAILTDANGRIQLPTVQLNSALSVALEAASNSPYLAASRTVPTTSVDPTTVRLVVARGASISGQLRDVAGSPVPYPEVSLLSTTGRTLRVTQADVAGKYRFIGLKSGKYRIQFNTRSNFAWANDAASTYGWKFWKGTSRWSEADTVTLARQTKTAPATARTRINATLVRARNISATLFGALEPRDVVIEGSSRLATFPWKSTSSGIGPQVFDAPVNRGYYRVAVLATDGVTKLWYTGNSTLVSADKTKAKRIYVSGKKDVLISIVLALPE